MAEIQCKRCGKTAPACEEVAYGGALGDEIKTTICDPCWKEWMAQSVIVINELRLNLRDAFSRETLVKHMKEFLKLQGPPAS